MGMRVDFVNEKAIVDASLTFRQMGILQESLQAAYTAIVTDPASTNTANAVQELEDLAKALGLGLDNTCEAVEQTTV
jgi:hypothetical protein